MNSARENFSRDIVRTRLVPAPSLGEGVFLKLESEQPTGSFKVRGALHALALHLELEVEEAGKFSLDPGGLDVSTGRDNLVVRAFESLHPADGISFRLRSEIPLARGLGSSAAAIVAGLYAADHLFELALSKEEMLGRATELEGHPDNVAAAIFGCCAFAAWGLDRLGYRLTIAIVLAVLLRGLERQGWVLSLVLTVGMAWGSFYVFSTLLRVPLPRGPLGF